MPASQDSPIYEFTLAKKKLVYNFMEQLTGKITSPKSFPNPNCCVAMGFPAASLAHCTISAMKWPATLSVAFNMVTQNGGLGSA